MNNDLISREWLYKEFKQRQNAALRWKEKAIIDDDEERKIRADATLCFLSEVKLTIDNAPTVYPICEDKACKYRTNERPHGEWIPVSERLPEKIGTYLVTLEYNEHGKGITTLWYHGNDIGWDLRVADVVTAWQPLPEAY